MIHPKYTFPIGIDISERDIYVGQVKETRKGLAIRGLMYKPFHGAAIGDDPGDIREDVADLLKEISGNKQFRGRRVVLHLPSRSIVSFPIHFHLQNSETLEEAILKNSKEYISFPIEEAIIDYPSLLTGFPVASEEYRAIITAVKKDQLEQIVHTLRKAGWVVEAVDFAVCSLIRLHLFLHGKIEHPALLSHIGHHQSLLTVATGEGILSERIIPWGIETMLSKITANLGLSGDKYKARLLLKNYGLGYENRNPAEDIMPQSNPGDTDNMYRVIYQIIIPYVEELVNQLYRMIGYLRSEQGNAVFEGIYLYGHGTFFHNLDKYIEARLNIPTSLINPLMGGRLSVNGLMTDPAYGSPFALALGLAMRKVTWF